jgi:hypothetical protein
VAGNSSRVMTSRWDSFFLSFHSPILCQRGFRGMNELYVLALGLTLGCDVLVPFVHICFDLLQIKYLSESFWKLFFYFTLNIFFF